MRLKSQRNEQKSHPHCFAHVTAATQVIASNLLARKDRCLVNAQKVPSMERPTGDISYAVSSESDTRLVGDRPEAAVRACHSSEPKTQKVERPLSLRLRPPLM